MTNFVIPAEAGIQKSKNWIPTFVGMTVALVMLCSCAHRGDLKSPTQARVAEEKAAAKEAKAAQEKAKEDAKAKTKTPEAEPQ